MTYDEFHKIDLAQTRAYHQALDENGYQELAATLTDLYQNGVWDVSQRQLLRETTEQMEKLQKEMKGPFKAAVKEAAQECADTYYEGKVSARQVIRKW